MENPDANGFVNITWPSKNIPHGGIFHTRVSEPTEGQRRLLKVLLEESKLTIAQRQKSAFKLREENERRSAEQQPQVRMPLVRPQTSRRRSLSTIRESGAFVMDGYRPLKRGEDREKMKDKLANTMAFGDNQEQQIRAPIIAKKLPPKLPTCKESWNELVTQIRERTEWLAEMEYLGQAGPHREIIKDQIAERMRALDALGIDSECSTPKSTDSGFSTRRSRERAPIGHKFETTVSIPTSRSDQSKKHIKQNSVRGQKKEENVASYTQLSPPV